MSTNPIVNTNYPPEIGASFTNFNSYLDSLGAYNLNAGVDSLLDQAREINYSGKFYFSGNPFPIGNATTFNAYETKQGSINFIPYSFIVSIGVYCGDPAGVKISIYDKGAKVYLFNNTIYALDRVIASNLSTLYPHNDPTTDTNNPDPNGPYFLTSPLIILPPGALQIEMTNLSSNSGVIAQLMFGTAVPITPKSINVHVINEG